MENDETMICFEVETTYKSGKCKQEYITTKDEPSMWKIYDKKHCRSKNNIADTMIVDCWPV